MKKVIAVIVVAALITVIFTSCREKAPEPQTEIKTISQAKNTAKMSTDQSAKSTEGSPSNKDNKAFEKWNAKDLSNYFVKEKVFDNKEYLLITDDEGEAPEGVSAEITYDDYAEGNTNILIFYFSPNTKNEKIEKTYKQIKKEKNYYWTEKEPQPFNALIGRFAIFYGASKDEEFKEKFEEALDKLIKEKNIKPDFYEKNLDLTQYYNNTAFDDDMIIIGDD